VENGTLDRLGDVHLTFWAVVLHKRSYSGCDGPLRSGNFTHPQPGDLEVGAFQGVERDRMVGGCAGQR
jgi:hypothetical protein